MEHIVGLRNVTCTLLLAQRSAIRTLLWQMGNQIMIATRNIISQGES